MCGALEVLLGEDVRYRFVPRREMVNVIIRFQQEAKPEPPAQLSTSI